MILQISYKAMKLCAAVVIFLLAVWLTVGHLAILKVFNDAQDDKVTFYLTFLAPMNREGTLKKLDIQSQFTGRKVQYSTEWVGLRKLKVTILEKDYPRGLEYRYRLKKAPALIPPFTVSTGGKVRHKVKPVFLSLEPKDNTPTTGPVLLRFNTPLKPKSFQEAVHIDASGTFQPVEVKEGSRSYKDYSRWQFRPHGPLVNEHKYKVEIKESLSSQFGLRSGKDINLHFTTAPELKVVEVYPREGSPSVWLSRHIYITANQKLKGASIKIDNLPGEVIVSGNTATFIPTRTLLPGQKYEINALLTSEYGEKKAKQFFFNTTNLGKEKWLEIKLENPCKIWVFAGGSEAKEIKGWLSLNKEKIPKVTLYEVARSQDRPQGTTEVQPSPWIKLNADILLHSLPQGAEDNHMQLGLPESFGCIYLPKADMDWLCRSMPEKFMVVVH